jgi:hypothetical protein
MKRSSIRKKAEKRSKLDEIDPLDDLDVSQLELVARGRGWGTNSKEGKRRARALAIPHVPARPQSRKRRGA